MNNKQKLGYMALGAGILAIGIAIGQIITPDIKAQNSGVFDKIVCRELEVVDRQGNTAIRAAGTPERGFLSIFGKRGYSRMTGESVAIYDLLHDRDAILIASWEDANLIKVYDKRGKDAIGLSSFKGVDVESVGEEISAFNKVVVMDQKEDHVAIALESSKVHNWFSVTDKKNADKDAFALTSNNADNNSVRWLRESGKMTDW